MGDQYALKSRTWLTMEKTIHRTPISQDGMGHGENSTMLKENCSRLRNFVSSCLSTIVKAGETFEEFLE